MGSTTSSATEEMGKAQVPSDPYKLNLKTQSQLTPTYKIFEYPMVKEVLELLEMPLLLEMPGSSSIPSPVRAPLSRTLPD